MTKKLTTRQRLFVDAYMGEANGNGLKAAQLAGYRKGAKVTACRLLTRPNVKAAIANQQQIVALVAATSAQLSITAPSASLIATLVERRQILTGIMRDKDIHPAVKIRAIDVENKVDGVYIEKHEHTVVPLFTLPAGARPALDMED